MAKVVTIPIGPIYMGGGCRGIVHVIRQGDTLYKLGKKYHVSVSSIMYANPYVNIYNLQIGDELCIPVAAPILPTGRPIPLPDDQEVPSGGPVVLPDSQEVPSGGPVILPDSQEVPSGRPVPPVVRPIPLTTVPMPRMEREDMQEQSEDWTQEELPISRTEEI